MQLPLHLVLGSDQLRGSGLEQEGLDLRPILLDLLLRRCLLVLGPLPQVQDLVDGGQVQTRHDARGDKPVHEHMGAQLNLNMLGCADLGNARTVTGTALGLERAPAVVLPATMCSLCRKEEKGREELNSQNNGGTLSLAATTAHVVCPCLLLDSLYLTRMTFIAFLLSCPC